MEQLIKQIEQWAEDRNIINGSKPIDQAMKLFSEFGELADNVGKGRDCRDDIGDCVVVATIICKQKGFSISRKMAEIVELEKSYVDNTLIEKQAICWALEALSSWVKKGFVFSDRSESLTKFLENLLFVANKRGHKITECVQIAYNDIKDRKGVMYNGVFIKESDPAYEDALLNLKADERQGQKRVSVNLGDL